MSHSSLKLVLGLLILTTLTQSYLEFRMERLPASGPLKDRKKIECITPEIDKKMTEDENKERNSEDDDEDVD